MFSVNDFIARYQQYSDEELMEVYNQINNYSEEAKEALNNVIDEKGGLQRLLHSAEKQKAKNTETERIEKETIQLAESGLMEEYPVEQLSVQMRERIVLPLLTIQQYAIAQLREMQEKLISSPQQQVYEKLIMRCSFGIINAARNSA